MRALAAAAALLLASCYEPGGQCVVDADCLDALVCGADGVCVSGTRPPPETAPVARPDPPSGAYAVTKDVPLDVPARGVLANDTDPDDAPLAAELVTYPTYGQVFLAPDGGFTYVPLAGWLGADAFTYRATNGVRSSAPATVSLTVAP